MPAEIDQSASAAYHARRHDGRPRHHPDVGRDWLQPPRAGTVGRLRARVRDAAVGPRRPGARDLGEGAGRRVGRPREGAEVLPRRSERRRRSGPWPGTSPAHAAPVPPPEPVGVDPGDMADRLADYAELFEREIAAVVAEERYVQIIHPWRGNPSGPQGEPALTWREPGEQAKQGGPIIARRQLLSDVVHGAAHRTGSGSATATWPRWTASPWATARTACATCCSRRPRIATTSSAGSTWRARATTWATSGATSNLPTVTLSLLRRQNHPRFQFKRAKDETIDGRPCRVLALPGEGASRRSSARRTAETSSSTGASGSTRPTGACAARNCASNAGRRAVRTSGWTSSALEGLAILVPALMWEWHEGGDQLGRIGGDVTVDPGSGDLRQDPPVPGDDRRRDQVTGPGPVLHDRRQQGVFGDAEVLPHLDEVLRRRDPRIG